MSLDAQIGRDHMEVRLQRAGDGIPAPAMIAAAMDQDERRSVLVAPIGIVQPQAMGLVVATLRGGHRGYPFTGRREMAAMTRAAARNSQKLVSVILPW